MNGNRGLMLCSAVAGTVVRLNGRKYRRKNFTVGPRVGQMVACMDSVGNIVHVGANAHYKMLIKVASLS